MSGGINHPESASLPSASLAIIKKQINIDKPACGPDPKVLVAKPKIDSQQWNVDICISGAVHRSDYRELR